MQLTSTDIAKMIDLSCVRTTSSKADIDEMVEAAKQYGFGQVSVMQSFIPYTRQLIQDNPKIRIVGNVSFPSGSDSTATKVYQAHEMVAAGCDEIDMVINVGFLKSGYLREVEMDVKAVREAIDPLPMKVIIESMYLTEGEIRQAYKICINSGATFVKTGTGWAERGTRVEDVLLIKSIVGDKVNIKASGGIRSLETLVKMYQAGARRFGINLKTGIQLLEEIINNNNIIEVQE